MTFSQNEQKPQLKFFLFFFLWLIFGAYMTFLILKSDFFTKESSLESEKNHSWTTFSQNVKNVKNSVFESKKVQEAYSILNENFYGFEKKTLLELENGMIKSMLSSLGDKHSEYFTFEEAEEFESGLAGEFEWIGAVIGESEFGVIIERVIKDSPAEKSGLKTLDVVTMADGISLKWMKPSEAVKKIRGKKWTTVHLTYLRDDVEYNIDVTRDAVNIPSVDAKKIENSEIGYIQINTFGERTPGEFQKAIRELRDQWAKGLILDFRFNGGGYLVSAQEMLGEFLPRNSKIVTTKENNPANNISLFTSLLSLPDENIPLIVLVNEYSASASEIVAGALQDYGRAIVIGNKTYGKWSVQEMLEMRDGSMIKVTVAHWYTPKDKNIDLEGITPDILVRLMADDYRNEFDRQKVFSEKVMTEMIAGKKMNEIIEYYKNNPEEISGLK